MVIEFNYPITQLPNYQSLVPLTPRYPFPIQPLQQRNRKSPSQSVPFLEGRHVHCYRTGAGSPLLAKRADVLFQLLQRVRMKDERVQLDQPFLSNQPLHEILDASR